MEKRTAKPPCPLDNQRLQQLADEYGTPFQLYDEQAIRDNLSKLVGAFRKHFPTFQNFFAVKALPNPATLQIVLESGCGLDCSSRAELYIADKLGVDPEHVMYTSNYTSSEDLEAASKQGVIINLDDVTLVESLLNRAGKLPDVISFRFNPGLGNTDSDTKSNILGGPSAKFGVPEDQIEAAYAKAKAHGVKRFGIHMMTGSCVLGDDYWAETVGRLLAKMAELQQKLGIEFEFVNIGGGIGIPYHPDDEDKRVDYATLAQRIRNVWEETLEANDIKTPPRLLMECGRCVTGPYGWLVSKCEVVKQAYGNKYCGLDACMANLMRPGMYGSYHHITVPGKTGPAKITKVVGTLCENNDWFAGGEGQKDQSLPSDCGVGDLFVIHDTGAHSHSMGFQYNGKLRAPELLHRCDGTVKLIRSRETIQGLYANTFQLNETTQTDWGKVLRNNWGICAIALSTLAVNFAVSHYRK